MRGSFNAKALALTRKDFRIELRGRDTLPPMLAFVAVVGLLLAFTLPGNPRLVTPVQVPGGTVALAEILSGFLWVTILFAGLMGFARTFDVEREEGALDALLLAPVDRSALFLSKAAANFAFVAAVEALLIPFFALLFGIGLGAGWITLFLVVVLVDIGFTVIGTLFASVAAQTRSRELILPILALPALIPVFIAAVELTSDLFLGGGFEEVAARGWFGLLIFFDVLFGIVGALVFEFVID